MKASMLDSQLAIVELPSIEHPEAHFASIKLGQGEGEEAERGLQVIVKDALDICRGWGVEPQC